MTTTAPPKLLVDEETGRVLVANNAAYVSRRYCETHSYITIIQGAMNDIVFAGPDARRRAAARRNNEGEKGLVAIEYRIVREVDGMLTLEKVL